ncbi:hypothetical protein [Streptomyces telluris]|uniref:Uncharacterized protein n=1 Tax=Streptomyces telluris TaxID=2720021 RepID=A0A9X2RQL5_9ACTN|nr:hypothetical protein [Streptomyces telluris]MCQ8775077.1 hypothetical protein [Streptomyces telluris]
MNADACDYFIELRDGHTPERPAALWRTAGDGGPWEYWSTAEWAWRPVGERRRVTAAPGREVLHPVSLQRAAQLQADRQGWAQYWVRYEDGPEGERIPQSVIRRRRSPEEIRCEFSSRCKSWVITPILGEPDEVDGRPGWERIPAAEADTVLERIKGRQGETELGRSGLHDARPDGPFRYFTTADRDGQLSGLWRREDDRWEYFSVLEWGWFPLHGQEGPEEAGLAAIDAECARTLETDRESWVRGYWLYWHYYQDYDTGERPAAIIREVSGARVWHHWHFPGYEDRWVDTDDVRFFPDYRSSNHPWLEKTDRAGAAQFLEEEYGFVGVLDH